MADAAENKPLRSDNSLLSEAENMFEDMGGDMFGDNDITEADFNFFDEQPDELGMDMSLDNIKRADAPTAIPIKAEEPALSASATVPIISEPVVFAKPELKHARSSQTEDGPQRGRDLQAKSVKRGSSPFDPDSVFKRLRAAISQQSQRAVNGGGLSKGYKAFGRVDFDSKMPMLNKKYEHGGFFDFVPHEKVTDKLEPGTIPKTDYFRRHSKAKAKAFAGSRRSSLAKSGNDLGSDHKLLNFDGDISDGDDSSTSSDNASNVSVKEPLSPVKSIVKQSLLGDDDAASYVTTSRDAELAEEPDEQLALELPRLSLLEGSDTSLFKYFTDPEPLSLDISLGDEDMIQVAQLVAEQAATGSLLLFNGHSDPGLVSAIEEDSRIEQLMGSRSALQALREAASSVFGTISPIGLKKLLEVQDGSLPGQGNRIQPRQVPSRDPNSEPIKPSNLYQIPCPHLEVRRADVKMSLLPTAVTFWENLGLAPSSGSKDIHAVCVCPKWTGMVDNAQTFLGRLKSAYETLKLGTFENMPLPTDMDDGVLLYGVDQISTARDATMMGHGSALLESMETLSSAMSDLEVVDTNVVVYFMYSASDPGTIVEACVAFQRFFESYRRRLSAKRESAKNEVVLQLVSADSVSSSTRMVVTASSELMKLCMETYDRCTLFGGSMPAPAIRLEQPLPRIIDFKLSPAPSSSLARENSCIHIAYARSIDGRWVTAAWTDDRGNEQTTAAYCLGRKGEAESRTMNDVANAIWETTIELISTWKVHYRIIMTKCGPTDEGEIDFWIDLARTEINASVTMIVMTVDTNPSLQLVPAPVKMPLQPLSMYTTPVSTPQASIVSPEASATPATPAKDAAAAAATPGGESTGDADVDSVLADVMDQTWGAIVHHRLNNAVGTASIQPALISGYLIKRSGPKAEDVPSMMEVNLVYTEATARTYEPLLREMLSYFRGLGTLARARGVVDRQADVRPWHVAAAEKALRALYILM
ncbi:Mediator complex, subunit Med13 [Cordyceps fumosorosea ARSEF 2679]|uniref:Mediator of RNA polymerase II transcription subunit 13 n=1 Tax=Cordyceps fumosorosea (strain ARSEF 2679) TaxID=1081104 RepID=A0A162JKX2_CORFA|nr:Mediator complex, subunit Med13 [Cordyceps fumosorosea ARSEF 2679]OAA70482.1 Mediator complex, subunit Med13 [Cordyceps fumosorosea ARSEF 2679]